MFVKCAEREENVKADIFYAYITLLKQTKPSVLQDSDSMEHEEGYCFHYCCSVFDCLLIQCILAVFIFYVCSCLKLRGIKGTRVLSML